MLLAFTAEHAARVAGISVRRIRYWDETGVLAPSLTRPTGRGGPFGRVYSFRDLVGLRTLADLRDRYGLPLQQLREVGAWLGAHYEAPWASLRFYIVGRGREAQIYFRPPDEDVVVSATTRGQIAITFDLAPVAQEVAAKAATLTERDHRQFGRIVRNRHVLNNASVIDGTRIPTAAIWEFYRAGYDTPAIIRQYPRLVPLDVECAITHERKRHPAQKAS